MFGKQDNVCFQICYSKPNQIDLTIIMDIGDDDDDDILVCGWVSEREMFVARFLHNSVHLCRILIKFFLGSCIL